MTEVDKLFKRYDQDRGEWFFVSICHECKIPIDLRGSFYEDSFGRWEFCTKCYVHEPHPGGETLAWWYSVERSQEMYRDGFAGMPDHWLPS